MEKLLFDHILDTLRYRFETDEKEACRSSKKPVCSTPELVYYLDAALRYPEGRAYLRKYMERHNDSVLGDMLALLLPRLEAQPRPIVHRESMKISNEEFCASLREALGGI